MARLLVRTVDGENSQRYISGDIVSVHPDNHIFGRMESLTIWVSEGFTASSWPGGFVIVDLIGMPVEEANLYLVSEYLAGTVQPEISRRRRYTINYTSLERRSPASGRDSLNKEFQIARNSTDSDVKAAIKLKV